MDISPKTCTVLNRSLTIDPANGVVTTSTSRGSLGRDSQLNLDLLGKTMLFLEHHVNNVVHEYNSHSASWYTFKKYDVSIQVHQCVSQPLFIIV